MAQFVLQIGSCSAQGIRPNNEDRFVVDREHQLFIVADGMGGQEQGERASGMAAEIIPRVVHDGLAQQRHPDSVMQLALAEANKAILEAGIGQPENRRMGTTAVVALQQDGKMYVANLGDSRAYLIRGERVEQLTVDHSVAQALVDSGVFTPEEARQSPLQHVLHRFLGCAHMPDGADIHPFTPEGGDRLLMGTDGLTNHVTDADMIEGARSFKEPQSWAEHLVKTALERGSRDNVTCVVVFFEPK